MFGFLRRKVKDTPQETAIKNTAVGDDDIINAYGRVLEQQTSHVMDEKLLPYPKEVIKAALVRWIPKVAGDIRKAMESGLVSLAQFQPGVGNAEHVTGMSPDLLEAAMAEPDTHKAAKMLVAAKHGSAAASDEVVARIAAEERELLALSQSLR